MAVEFGDFQTDMLFGLRKSTGGYEKKCHENPKPLSRFLEQFPVVGLQGFIGSRFPKGGQPRLVEKGSRFYWLLNFLPRVINAKLK